MADLFVSYAQNFEDVILWRALSDVRNGFYVDVGAYSPIEDSVTKAFYDRGWHGINIEPDLRAYEPFLVARPRDVNLNIAIGDRTGRQTMYFVRDSGLSTLDDHEAQARVHEGREVITGSVAVTTLNTVWADKIPATQPVHFLKIDVEGFERQVLAGNDWVNCRPWVVVVESTRPNTQEATYEAWESLVTEHDYELIYHDGLNRFYLANEHRDLAVRFAEPPNPFDRFVRATEMHATARAQSAEAELALMKTSLSWRLTRPIRAPAALVRMVTRRIRKGSR